MHDGASGQFANCRKSSGVISGAKRGQQVLHAHVSYRNYASGKATAKCSALENAELASTVCSDRKYGVKRDVMRNYPLQRQGTLPAQENEPARLSSMLATPTTHVGSNYKGNTPSKDKKLNQHMPPLSMKTGALSSNTFPRMGSNDRPWDFQTARDTLHMGQWGTTSTRTPQTYDQRAINKMSADERFDRKDGLGRPDGRRLQENAMSWSSLRKGNSDCVLRVSNLDFAISNDEWEMILRRYFSTVTCVKQIRFGSGASNCLNDEMNSPSGSKRRGQDNRTLSDSYRHRRNGVAFVTVASYEDASKVIAMYHHKKIGYKKINIHMAGRTPSDLMEVQRKVVHTFESLNSSFKEHCTDESKETIPTRQGIPLSVFCKRYAAMNGCSVHLNDLECLPNTVQIRWTASRLTKGRSDCFLVPVYDTYACNRNPALTDMTNVADVAQRPNGPRSSWGASLGDRGTRHLEAKSSRDKKGEVAHGQLGQCTLCEGKADALVCSSGRAADADHSAGGCAYFVCRPGLRSLTVQMHELMNRHNGSLVLSHFVGCHNRRFGSGSIAFCRANESFDSGGMGFLPACSGDCSSVPLEHLISSIPNIVIRWHRASGQIRWARSACILSSFYEQPGHALTAEASASGHCSPSDAAGADICGWRALFARQARYVLSNYFLVPTSLFHFLYQQTFQRQLRVADYGCSKFVELISTVPDAIQVLGQECLRYWGDDCLMVQHRVQTNRFAGILYLVLYTVHRRFARSMDTRQDMAETDHLLNEQTPHEYSFEVNGQAFQCLVRPIDTYQPSSQHLILMVPTDQLINLIKAILAHAITSMGTFGDTHCHSISGQGNRLLVSEQSSNFNEFQSSPFSIPSLGVTCLDDLIFSIESFHDFVFIDNAIGLNTTYLSGATTPSRCISGLAGDGNRDWTAIDFELVEVLRRHANFSVDLTSLDRALVNLLEDMLVPWHVGEKGCLLQHLIPFTFKRLARLSDDEGADWPYVTAMLNAHLASPETARVAKNPLSLSSLLALSNRMSVRLALVRNIHELMNDEANGATAILRVDRLEQHYFDHFGFPLDPHMLGSGDSLDLLRSMCPTWFQLFVHRGALYVRESITAKMTRIRMVSLFLSELEQADAQGRCFAKLSFARVCDCASGACQEQLFLLKSVGMLVCDDDVLVAGPLLHFYKRLLALFAADAAGSATLTLDFIRDKVLSKSESTQQANDIHVLRSLYRLQACDLVSISKPNVRLNAFPITSNNSSVKSQTPLKSRHLADLTNRSGVGSKSQVNSLHGSPLQGVKVSGYGEMGIPDFTRYASPSFSHDANRMSRSLSNAVCSDPKTPYFPSNISQAESPFYGRVSRQSLHRPMRLAAPCSPPPGFGTGVENHIPDIARAFEDSVHVIHSATMHSGALGAPVRGDETMRGRYNEGMGSRDHFGCVPDMIGCHPFATCTPPYANCSLLNEETPEQPTAGPFQSEQAWPADDELLTDNRQQEAMQKLAAWALSLDLRTRNPSIRHFSST